MGWLSIEFGRIISHTLPGIPVVFAIAAVLKLVNVELPNSTPVTLTLFVLGSLLIGIWIDGFHHMIGDLPFRASNVYRDWEDKAKQTYTYLTKLTQERFDLRSELIEHVGPFTWEQFLVVFGGERYARFMDNYFHYYEFFINLAYSLTIFTPIAALYAWMELNLSTIVYAFLLFSLMVITALTYRLAWALLILTRKQQVQLSLLVTAATLNSGASDQISEEKTETRSPISQDQDMNKESTPRSRSQE